MVWKTWESLPSAWYCIIKSSIRMHTLTHLVCSLWMLCALFCCCRFYLCGDDEITYSWSERKKPFHETKTNWKKAHYSVCIFILLIIIHFTLYTLFILNKCKWLNKSGDLSTIIITKFSEWNAQQNSTCSYLCLHSSIACTHAQSVWANAKWRNGERVQRTFQLKLKCEQMMKSTFQLEKERNPE